MYFSIGAALILLARLIHYRTVTRYLRNESVPITGQSSIRDWNEWAAYKQARLCNHEPLRWWYVLLGNSGHFVFLDARLVRHRRGIAQVGHTNPRCGRRS